MIPWIPYNKPYKKVFGAEGYKKELDRLNLLYSDAMIAAMTSSEQVIYQNKCAAVRQQFIDFDVFELSQFNTPGVQIKLNTGKIYLIGDIDTGCSGGDESVINGDEIVTHYRVLCRPDNDPIEFHTNQWACLDYRIGLLKFYIRFIEDKTIAAVFNTTAGFGGILVEFSFPRKDNINEVKKHVLSWYFTCVAPPT